MAKTTTEKGLGQRHRLAVEQLKRTHQDGSPCDWCGRPMFLDARLNFDYDPLKPGKRGNGVLQGDHSITARSDSLRKGEPVLPPDRLLHGECNRQRGRGGNDHLAVVNHTEELSMPWPWS